MKDPNSPTAPRYPLDAHIEVVSGAFLLLIAALLPRMGASEDMAWFLGVMAVLLPMTTVAIKAYVAKMLRVQGASFADGPGRAATLIGRTVSLNEPHARFALDVLREAEKKVQRIADGIVPLTEAEYFDHVIERTRHLKSGDELIAVNAFSEARWLDDPREVLFLDENRRAVEKGAQIHRLFIIDAPPQKGSVSVAERVMQLHADAGIRVSYVLRMDLLGKSDLMADWVLFDGKEPRLYVDYQDRVDPTRVERGELYLNPSDHEIYARNFRVLVEHSRRPGTSSNGEGNAKSDNRRIEQADSST